MTNITHFWARLRQGRETGSFENALRPHIRPLYRLAVHYCGNPQEAEELLQELLYRLYMRQSEVLAVEKPRPWLARVLYNLFVDRFRREQLRPAAFSELGWEEEAANEVAAIPMQSEEQPERELEQNLTRERLLASLQKLSPPQRVLVLMHDVEEYTLNELETILETPLGTLKSRLHRARERLRGILLEEGQEAGNQGTFSGDPSL
jgi:RNA polymerase sigma-70 factor (ECF subfamily)